MTINEFIEALNKLGVSGDQQLCVHSFGGIGGSGREIKRVAKGFDWDQGMVMIHTEQPLTLMPTKAEKPKGEQP
jgi:hypothetical protein